MAISTNSAAVSAQLSNLSVRATCGALLVGGLLGLLANLPAAWVLPYLIPPSLPLRLQAPAGSVWAGSARLEIQGAAAAFWPGRISWRLRPVGWTKWQLILQNGQLTQPVALVFQLWPKQFKLGAGTLNLPASWLSELGAPWNTLQVGGQLRLDWQAWQATPQNFSGKLRLEWHNASAVVSRVAPLGDYLCTVVSGNTPAAPIQVACQTARGPLQVTLQGTWDNRRFIWHGSVQAAPEQAASLQGILNLLGRRSAEQPNRVLLGNTSDSISSSKVH